MSAARRSGAISEVKPSAPPGRLPTDLMVSMSGYSCSAVKEASRDKTPLLLLDFKHLYTLFTGSLRFSVMVTRVRRHSSQTGEASLLVEDFGK